ncbi:MAG: 16S rRNA (cytidine(1402)-2'-O)-methyltransferase [Burkholderiales bacterium]|nr:16S rRNA (cytidine(1402)-2'-O)-methyltransferase [Burkholderiales bacterium]
MTFDAKPLLQAASQVAAGQQYPKGALYLVASPIGNLADLTLRAVQVLTLADIVACEDTRVTGRLLNLLGLDKKLMAVHQHNEIGSAQTLMEAMKGGARVAYLSDAGTPAVSDPGAQLVRATRDAGLKVVPIPGASSVVTAVSAAGDVHAEGFHFLGFLPAKGLVRTQRLQGLLQHPASLVLFEAPHRVETLSQELAELVPDRLVTICRELTKQFEDIVTLPARALPAWLKGDPNRQRGEFVWVVHAPEAQAQSADLPLPAQALMQHLVQHLPIKQAASLVADATGLNRKQLYETALSWRKHDDSSS